MKKAVLYARVSSDRQKDEKTIDSQISLLEEKIKQDGNILVEKYLDDGWTGETVDRPALMKLRDDAKNGLFEMFYIYHLDRLSRELGNQLYIINEFKRYEIEIHTAQGRIDDDPNNRLLIQMQGIVAEQEKLRILDRTRTGRLQKAKRGVIVGSKAPFGYRYIKKVNHKDGYYEINNKEADIVKSIFNYFIELRSIRAVVKKITNEGLTPPKDGEKWGKSTIYRILTREDYIGTAYYNKHYSVETKNSRERKFKKILRTGRKLRNREEWIPITVPPILEKEIFYITQDILKNNRKVLRRTPNNKYLLSGLVSCDICKSLYCSNPCHGRTFYRCSNRNKNFPLPRDCEAKMISTYKIDGLVWDEVKNAILNPDIIIKHLKRLSSNYSESVNSAEKQIDSLTKGLDDLSTRENRLLDVYSEGLIGKEVLTKRLNEAREEKDNIRANIEKLEKLRDSNIDKDVAIKNIRFFCKLAKKRVKSFDFEQKKQFLGLVVDKISLNTLSKQVKITTIIPAPNTGFQSVMSKNGGLLPLTS